MDSEKCSRRRRRGTTSRCLVLAAFVLASPSAWVQSDEDPPDINALDAFIREVETFSASFRQETWTPEEELLETVTGSLSLQRPDRFRWEFRTPYELLVVADGQTLWMYDVELEQVTRTPMEDELTATPAMLLSGERAASESFDIAQTYRLDDRDWMKLTPKQAGSDYSSVLIGFNHRLPEQLELVDGLNQITRIQFFDIEVNAKLDEKLFEFEPPKGVDVIGDAP